MTIREIANSLAIDSVKIPENRMTEEERKSLQSVVKSALTDMSLEQKARILAIFILHGKKKAAEPSAKVLLKIGIPEATEAITRVFGQKSVWPDHLSRVITLLKEIEPSIEKVLSEADKTFRLMDRRDEVSTLIEALGDKGTGIRGWAAEALGRIGKPVEEAVPVLTEMLNDESGWVRTRVVQALGQISGPAAVTALIQAFGDENQSVRGWAVSAVEQIGQPVVPALIKTLRETEERMIRRSYAASLLSRIGGQSVIPVLMEVLGDKHPGVRGSVARALGAIGSTAAVPALMEILGDKYSIARISAAEALGAIGAPVAVPVLTEALKDENRRVRRQAAEALRKIGTPEAMEAVGERQF